VGLDVYSMEPQLCRQYNKKQCVVYNFYRFISVLLAFWRGSFQSFRARVG